MILTTLGAGAAFAFQVTMATFAQAYALQHGATRPQVLLGFAVASFLAIFGVLLAGRLSDRFGRRPVLVVGIVGWAALAFPMFALWGSGNALLITLGFVIGLQFQSLTYGPLGAFISEQFGTKARYTGASLGYQLATLLGGGFTPGILAALARNSGGDVAPVAMFLIAMGVISTIAVLAIREGRHNDLHDRRALSAVALSANFPDSAPATAGAESGNTALRRTCGEWQRRSGCSLSLAAAPAPPPGIPLPSLRPPLGGRRSASAPPPAAT